MQVHRELVARDYISDAELVFTEETGPATWVALHVPRRKADEQNSIGVRRGYALRLSLDQAITGPLRLGHSSSFGLGLFVPI